MKSMSIARRPVLVCLLVSYSISAFPQENLSFEAITDKLPDHWNLNAQGMTIAIDDAVAHEGSRSMRMTGTASSRGNSFAVITQGIPIEQVVGDRLVVSGYIQSRSITDGSAGLWVRLDGPDGVLMLDNMLGRGATGTTEWTPFTIEMSVPDSTQRAFFGAMLSGSGTAWFDELSVRYVDSATLPPPSEHASNYLDAAIDLMEEHSIIGADVDWMSLRESAFLTARGAVARSDTYPAIRSAINRLGDRHSQLFEPAAVNQIRGVAPAVSPDIQQAAMPIGEILDGEIGYVRVPGFVGTAEQAATQFADELQRVIEAIDTAHVCGWIVDLRVNGGGNVWPMLAGLGPLLGDGIIAGNVYADSRQVWTWYRSGSAGVLEDTVRARVSRKPYELSHLEAPTAVLLGAQTASAGEALAIAFIGRRASRTFGSITAGLTTGNAGYPLDDGAVLNLAVTVMTDREGNVYRGAIVPDQIVQPATKYSERPVLSDIVIDKAITWLKVQALCSQ